MIVDIEDFLDEWAIKRIQPIREGLRIQVNEDVLEFKDKEWHLLDTTNGFSIDKVILNEH